MTSTRRFIIGIILLAAAIGFGAAVVFSGKPVTHEAYYVFLVFIALAGGFAAWSFAGSIKVESQVGRLLVAATGGFAVFFLVFFFLPRPQVIGSITPPEDVNRSKVDELRSEHIELRAIWETFDEGGGTDEALRRVYTDAPNVVRRLEVIKPLRRGTGISRDTISGYAWLIGGDAAHRLNKAPDRETFLLASLSALDRAERAISETFELAAEGDASCAALRDLLMQDHDLETIRYLRSIVFALRSTIDDGPKRDALKERALMEFRKIPKNIIPQMMVNPRHTPYLALLLGPSDFH